MNAGDVVHLRSLDDDLVRKTLLLALESNSTQFPVLSYRNRCFTSSGRYPPLYHRHLNHPTLSLPSSADIVSLFNPFPSIQHSSVKLTRLHTSQRQSSLMSRTLFYPDSSTQLVLSIALNGVFLTSILDEPQNTLSLRRHPCLSCSDPLLRVLNRQQGPLT